VLGSDSPEARRLRAVYPPREDTELLLRAVPQRVGHPDEWLLEVGTGNGRVALEAARRGFRTIATDLNLTALGILRETSLGRGLSIAVVRTDLLSGLRRFHRILFNPPYLPTVAATRDPDRWQNAALDGGPEGWSVTHRFLRELADHLFPGGRASVIVSSRQSKRGRQQAYSGWRRQGGRIRTVARQRFTNEGIELVEFRAAASRRRTAAAAVRRGAARADPGSSGRARKMTRTPRKQIAADLSMLPTAQQPPAGAAPSGSSVGGVSRDVRRGRAVR
jgi:release factor glutamine methyltransferase